MNRRFVKLEILALALVIAAGAGVREARCELAHRYSFDGDASDSIGSAHGTIVDAGFTANAMFSGGQLDLSANTGEPSNGITEDAYVDLPNGMISPVASGGTSGAFSIELWATVSETHTWQRYVDFGTSNDGEDTSNSGSASPYVYIAPNSGRFGDGLASEAHEPDQDGVTEVGQGGPLPTAQEFHVVGTYDENDTSASPDGTLRLYQDGVLIGSAGLPPNLDLNTFTNDNNWIGRSQWPDSVFDGLFNELRIYDNVLSANDVATNTVFGPDALPGGELLSLTVDRSDGTITMTNNASLSLDLDFYQISSAGSALSVGGWESLDDQNYDAVDGPDGGSIAGDSDGEGWDAAGGSDATQLVELFLGEAGSTIDGEETLSLGQAFGGGEEDLEFTFGLVGGLRITGNVTYVGEPGGGTDGDYNGDGVVDARDYTVWRDNLGSDATLPNDPTPGSVDADDYDTWVSNYGQTSGAAAAGSPAPEPAAWVLSVLAVGAIGVRRRAGLGVR